MFAVLAFYLSADDFCIFGPFTGYEEAEAFADRLREKRPAVSRIDVFQMIDPSTRPDY